MTEKNKEIIEELRNKLKCEREILSVTEKEYEKLMAEHSEDADYYERQMAYKKLINEKICHIKELEEKFANITKILFIENEIDHQKGYNKKISKEIEWKHNELGFKQHRITEMRNQIQMLQNEIETCKNDQESLIKEISELEFIYNETFDKIKNLKKDLAEAKAKEN